jgi:hypothetical protein
MRRQRSGVNRQAEAKKAIGDGPMGNPSEAWSACAQSSIFLIAAKSERGQFVSPRRILNSTIALRFAQIPFLQLSTVPGCKQSITPSSTASYGKHAVEEEGIENFQEDGEQRLFVAVEEDEYRGCGRYFTTHTTRSECGPK